MESLEITQSLALLGWHIVFTLSHWVHFLCLKPSGLKSCLLLVEAKEKCCPGSWESTWWRPFSLPLHFQLLFAPWRNSVVPSCHLLQPSSVRYNKNLCVCLHRRGWKPAMYQLQDCHSLTSICLVLDSPCFLRRVAFSHREKQTQEGLQNGLLYNLVIFDHSTTSIHFCIKI